MTLDQTNHAFTNTTKKLFDAHSAGGIVMNQDKEIALIEQGGVSWSFPKGHLEDNESPLEAAKREILEEAGIKDLVLHREFESYIRTSDEYSATGVRVIQKKITLFLFFTENQALQNPTGLITGTRWIAKDKVATILTHPRDKEFFTQNVLPLLQ